MYSCVASHDAAAFNGGKPEAAIVFSYVKTTKHMTQTTWTNLTIIPIARDLIGAVRCQNATRHRRDPTASASSPDELI